MGVVESVAGATIAVNLMNGKIKPKKKGFSTYIGLGFLTLILIGFIAWLIVGLKNVNIESIFISLIGIFSIGYLLLISPYTQNSDNYSIKVANENSFEGFELYYKQKKVELKYSVDEKGKFKFANNNSKLDCISYSDGTKMSNMTKYKIVNYFTAWLMSNDYLSDDVTVTFEKI